MRGEIAAFEIDEDIGFTTPFLDGGGKLGSTPPLPMVEMRASRPAHLQSLLSPEGYTANSRYSSSSGPTTAYQDSASSDASATPSTGTKSAFLEGGPAGYASRDLISPPPIVVSETDSGGVQSYEYVPPLYDPQWAMERAASISSASSDYSDSTIRGASIAEVHGSDMERDHDHGYEHGDEEEQLLSPARGADYRD